MLFLEEKNNYIFIFQKYHFTVKIFLLLSKVTGQLVFDKWLLSCADHSLATDIVSQEPLLQTKGEFKAVPVSKAMQFNKLWVITFLWQRGPEKFVLLYKRIWDSTKMPDWTLMEFEDIKGIFIKLIPKVLWIKEFSFMKWNSAMHFRLKVNRELAYQYKANVCNSLEFIALMENTFVFLPPVEKINFSWFS